MALAQLKSGLGIGNLGACVSKRETARKGHVSLHRASLDWTAEAAAPTWFVEIRPRLCHGWTGESSVPTRSVMPLAPCFGWLFFCFVAAYFEGHLAGFLVGVDDYVVAVQDFAVQNLQG